MMLRQRPPIHFPDDAELAPPINPNLPFVYDQLMAQETTILNTAIARYHQRQLTAEEALHSIVSIATLRQLYLSLSSPE